MATNDWTIKELVAHLVAWERNDPGIIKESWKTKQKPWFTNNKPEDDDVFNKEGLKYYKKFTPEQLIEEWSFYQKQVRETVEEIGEENLKQYPDIFGWLFDDKHYNHHYNQIKKILDEQNSVKNIDKSDFKYLATLQSWQVEILEAELSKKQIPVKFVVRGTNFPWNYGGRRAALMTLIDVLVPESNTQEGFKIINSLGYNDDDNNSERRIPSWAKWIIILFLLSFIIPFLISGIHAIIQIINK